MTGSLPGITAGDTDLKPDKDSVLYRSDEENKCQEAALRLLDAAPRSSGALRTRLIAKGYEEETVGKVIRRLVSSRLIDDGQYARSMVQYCLSRFLGEYGTRQELRKKEVEGPLITAVVEEAREAGKFENSAYELALKVSKKPAGWIPEPGCGVFGRHARGKGMTRTLYAGILISFVKIPKGWKTKNKNTDA